MKTLILCVYSTHQNTTAEIINELHSLYSFFPFRSFRSFRFVVLKQTRKNKTIIYLSFFFFIFDVSVFCCRCDAFIIIIFNVSSSVHILFTYNHSFTRFPNTENDEIRKNKEIKNIENGEIKFF